MGGYIDINSIVFGYGGETVLQQVSLSIAKGEFVSVIGPSGCGKSTLLRLLAGLIFPAEGSITVDNQPVTGPGLDRAVVFQDYSLFPWMSCLENVTLALEQARLGATKAERTRIAEKYLELVGLSGEGRKLPGELSGGMRQRSAIARALAQNAPLLLMDEPFGALDEITRAKQQDALLELWQGSSGGNGKTVLFVTHDVEEALILGDRVILMGSKPGRVAFELKTYLSRPRSHGSALRHPRFVELRNILLDRLNELVDEQIEKPSIEQDGSGI
ncbi:MAG: ABC transporter ATP-binding protein [Spirochaetaceae bacterium]|jgi:ABC-type nitrate/sulfonate/bicarbonate transport system ATPase subunit|nr:ABC transporter ATP-binding protein [Spirochaetaceae bacterium]